MHTRYLRFGLGCVLMLLLASCTGLPQVPTAQAPAQRPQATPPPGLIVLQSDESRAYADVTQSIIARWKGKVEVHQVNPYLEIDEEM